MKCTFSKLVEEIRV